MTKPSPNKFFMLLVLTLLMSGCASVRHRNPLPEALSPMAEIPGISSSARAWGDVPPPNAEKWLNTPKAELQADFPAMIGAAHTYLAISGGGASGAYGAGLLVGWTARGDRPEFSIVTGVSTGSLIAPFAFLGPDYDAQLEEVYTTISTKDIVRKRPLLEILTGDSAVSTEPFQKLLAKYVDREMMLAIAAEHRKGRRLWVGTTNLDAGRPVIWSIGHIAASGDEKALDLIHHILLASASIPGVFPPVFIEVEAEGARYDEMHVDGGAASQVFLFPTGVNWSRVAEKLEVKGKPHAYVIRNSRLDPEWQTIEPKLASIAERTIDSMIRTQGFGDIYRIYLSAVKEGLDFNLTFIPRDFDLKPEEPFDPEYMQKLFDLGFQIAQSGDVWVKTPPGF